MEEITECPLCGGNQFIPYIKCTDTLVSQRVFCIQQCINCNLLLTNPRPDATTIGHYYQSDAYISHDDTRDGLMDFAYRTVRSFTLQQKEKMIRESIRQIGRVLDYGCGTGAFLETCQKKGWTVQGYEPDPDARKLATNRIGKAIINDVKTIQSSGPFDVITLWHVLEHVADLKTTTRLFNQSLRVGGSLIIAVPNPASYDARRFKEHWAAYDVPRHLYHFMPEVMKRLVESEGFVLERQVPMKFDAYYISLMSTKARDGRIRYLDSLKAGLASNHEAAETGNYSSLTYLFRKVK
ncbi:class I SAM-dependent methyltransferase [Fibrella sp. HMF5335]|uniref:Class I SAM-dependent methyltransferase n=1 Tax=Fibrella rubiginis TaxID=2817060 RepID=A0A939K5Q2_9BACT|nr:class I SAM-dependent methyltransferase [Fibrella rubiginis]MBO0939729.1 class I SAM-dependent methyltransferase [Fibrella rubiginis]